jgi:hypothetical protein
MEKINEEKVKTGNFLHYWNGEKEWGKNINNGEKLLMKMGKILSWILIISGLLLNLISSILNSTSPILSMTSPILYSIFLYSSLVILS